MSTGQLTRPGPGTRPGRWIRSARGTRSGRPAGAIIVAGLLAAAAIAWVAVPVAGAPPGGAVRGGASRGTEAVMIAAICCAVLAFAYLVAPPAAADESAVFAPLMVRAWWRLIAIAGTVPWADGVVVTVLGLEALHRSRPWHTAVAGAVLLAYLLGTHMAETGQPARSLRPQLPLIAAGLGLLALVTAAAALPVGTGTAASWLRVLAVAAAVIVAALIVPV